MSWERQVEEVLFELGWEKSHIENVWLFIENKDYSYRKKWNDFKMAGQKQNMAPMWKKLMKNVELDEPTSFLDHVYWDALNVNANRMKSLRNIHKMFESLISAGATEKLPGWEKPHAKTVAWSYDVERYCELANNKVEQLYKVSSPCLDDHRFKQELESVGEKSLVCSQIVLKCLYLARTGRPDILWSINKFARAVTKWTQACDRRLARMISYIQHTNDYQLVLQIVFIPRLRLCWRP